MYSADFYNSPHLQINPSILQIFQHSTFAMNSTSKIDIIIDYLFDQFYHFLIINNILYYYHLLHNTLIARLSDKNQSYLHEYILHYHLLHNILIARLLDKTIIIYIKNNTTINNIKLTIQCITHLSTDYWMTLIYSFNQFGIYYCDQHQPSNCILTRTIDSYKVTHFKSHSIRLVSVSVAKFLLKKCLSSHVNQYLFGVKYN